MLPDPCPSTPSLRVKRLSLRAATFLLSLWLPGKAPAQAVPPAPDQGEWSSVDAFWRIHDALRADHEPDEGEWTALMATPGYALLHERERRGPLLRRAFRLAYKPSLSDSLAPARTRQDWVAFVLPHLEEVSARRADLSAFRARIGARRLMDSARALAQAWLPEGATRRLAPPEVSWVVFHDARGYPRILLDPLHVMQHGTPLELIGHELHHNYRNRLAIPSRPYGDDLLAWALVNVEVEGIAGLVDKRALTRLDSAGISRRHPPGSSSWAYFAAYPLVYRASPQWLRVADSLLVRIASSRDTTEQRRLARTLHGSLPDNGRAMGSWMSEVILEYLGHDALMRVVGDGFGFWLTYQRAAERSAGQYPLLAPAAIQLITQVAEQYRGA